MGSNEESDVSAISTPDAFAFSRSINTLWYAGKLLGRTPTLLI
jgi:hypothetical protein